MTRKQVDKIGSNKEDRKKGSEKNDRERRLERRMQAKEGRRGRLAGRKRAHRDYEDEEEDSSGSEDYG